MPHRFFTMNCSSDMVFRSEMTLDWAKVIWYRANDLWPIYVQMFPTQDRAGLLPRAGAPGGDLVASYSVPPCSIIGEAVSQNNLCAWRTVAHNGRASC